MHGSYEINDTRQSYFGKKRHKCHDSSVSGTRVVLHSRKALLVPCADPEGSNHHKAIGFLSNTRLGPLENHSAIKPAFNLCPSSARQRNTISLAFSWRVDDGQLLVVFGSSLYPNQLKKHKSQIVRVELDPL